MNFAPLWAYFRGTLDVHPTLTQKIPPQILRKKKNINAILRGFFDTDGCIYFTKNNSKLRNYPIIELSTHDSTLLKQFKEILENKNFKIRISHYKDSIKLYGKKNILKWMNEIGSNNLDKYSKFLFWKKYGYCPKINELPLNLRLKKMGLPGFEPGTSGSPSFVPEGAI